MEFSVVIYFPEPDHKKFSPLRQDQYYLLPGEFENSMYRKMVIEEHEIVVEMYPDKCGNFLATSTYMNAIAKFMERYKTPVLIWRRAIEGVMRPDNQDLVNCCFEHSLNDTFLFLTAEIDEDGTPSNPAELIIQTDPQRDLYACEGEFMCTYELAVDYLTHAIRRHCGIE